MQRPIVIVPIDHRDAEIDRLRAALAAARARVSELEAIVSRMPKTADNVPVVPGIDNVFTVREEGKIRRECTITTDPMCGWRVKYEDISKSYGTREAAEAERIRT